VLVPAVPGLSSHRPPQPLEIFVDDETKLTLHGLQQHFVKLEEVQKNRKLNELLDTLEFNQVRRPRLCTLRRIDGLAQVVIFVKSVSRCIELDKLLVSCNFPSISIHSGLKQEERYVAALGRASVRRSRARSQHRALLGVQGIREAHPRGDGYLRSWDRRRAREHRHQLRLPD
jgi:hypothetical protein